MAYFIYINQKKISSNALKAAEEYIKRLSPYCKLTVKPQLSINNKKRNNEYNIMLTPDKEKKLTTLSSEKFAEKLNLLSVGGISTVNMYIGYAENDIECDEKFCISHLELKPEIMLVALTEQIYRGYAINNNITYHK